MTVNGLFKTASKPEYPLVCVQLNELLFRASLRFLIGS